MRENALQNTFDVEITKSGKPVAHVGCRCFENTIYIRNLYVLKNFRSQGLGDVLLSKVFEYAQQHNANRIISYCGPEPFCPDGQIPLEEEVAWYTDHGFTHTHDVCGVTPCMVKELAHET